MYRNQAIFTITLLYIIWYCHGNTCSPGQFMDAHGVCLPCPIGTYSTILNATKCNYCGEGMITTPDSQPSSLESCEGKQYFS